MAEPPQHAVNIETLANVLLLLAVIGASGAWYAYCKLHAGTQKVQDEIDKVKRSFDGDLIHLRLNSLFVSQSNIEKAVRDLLRMHFDAERARVVPS